MNKDRRESEYPAELETHFVMRLPEEPAKQLREVLQTGDSLKNRLTIQIENDMRSGEVRFDHWLMHAKIVDLPTIVESLKTIDTKSFYKCADICQMMICKTEPDVSVEDETCTKNKKKDPYKVDKKFLHPHGITPPTKNVRKRRFRKTLKKKCVEAPEIEKEVKRLLRADNEAVSFTWEVIKEEDELPDKSDQSGSTGKATKADRKPKVDKTKWEQSQGNSSKEPSNVVDIFGGAVSDSEDEDNINVEMEDSHLSTYDSHLSDTNSMQATMEFQNPNKGQKSITEFGPDMFKTTSEGESSTSAFTYHGLSSEDIGDYTTHDLSRSENMQERIDQLRMEIEELKQRKQRTQHEITGIENLALRRRFQDILHTLNQDIMYKEMEYQGLLVMQNSEVI